MSTTNGNMKSFKVTDKAGNVYVLTPVDTVARQAIDEAKNLQFDDDYFTSEVSQDQSTVNIGLNGVPFGVESPLKFVQDDGTGIVLGSDSPLANCLLLNGANQTYVISDITEYVITEAVKLDLKSVKSNILYKFHIVYADKPVQFTNSTTAFTWRCSNVNGVESVNAGVTRTLPDMGPNVYSLLRVNNDYIFSTDASSHLIKHINPTNGNTSPLGSDLQPLKINNLGLLEPVEHDLLRIGSPGNDDNFSQTRYFIKGVVFIGWTGSDDTITHLVETAVHSDITSELYKSGTVFCILNQTSSSVTISLFEDGTSFTLSSEQCTLVACRGEKGSTPDPDTGEYSYMPHFYRLDL